MNKVKVEKYFEAVDKVTETIPVNQLAEFERAGWSIVPNVPVEQLPELAAINKPIVPNVPVEQLPEKPKGGKNQN